MSFGLNFSDKDGFPVSDKAQSVSSGGSASGTTVSVDFGASFTHTARTVVTGESWVSSSGSFSVCPLTSSADAYEIVLLGFSWVVSDVVDGDGFTLTVYSEAEAKGAYTFSVVGT